MWKRNNYDIRIQQIIIKNTLIRLKDPSYFEDSGLNLFAKALFKCMD